MVGSADSGVIVVHAAAGDVEDDRVAVAAVRVRLGDRLPQRAGAAVVRVRDRDVAAASA